MFEAPQVAEVLILRKVRQLSEPLDYLVPEEYLPYVRPGTLVRVPLRYSESIGLVVELKSKSFFKDLKPITEVLVGAPSLSVEQISLLRWISEFYIESPGAVSTLFFPSNFPVSLEKKITLLTSDAPAPLYEYLVLKGGTASYSELKRKFGPQKTERLLKEALKKESIKVFWSLKQLNLKPKVSYDIFLADTERLEKLLKATKSKRLKAFLSELREKSFFTFEEAKEYYQVSLAELKRLETSGALKLVERFVHAGSLPLVETYDSEVTLTDDQKQAIQKIRQAIKGGKAKEFLVYGPTGSGKTEVYLKACEFALSQGYSAIYLVPEISLTPQTYSRIEKRFPGKTAVFHSALKGNERLSQWFQVSQGLKQIIVGPRSALFMPAKNLKLIIIDEEHDSSYRQESSPVYDARKVARKISELTGAVIVYGSATPSIERMYEARKGKIKLLRLSKRVSGTMPEVEVVNLRKKREILTEELKTELLNVVEKGQKAIIFLNRRGYSVVEVCNECGYLATCPRCAVYLRYHKDLDKLRCHYCGYSRQTDKACPSCGSLKIFLKGKGIQQIEDRIKELVEKKARVVRMDSDVVRSGEGRKKIYEFYQEEASVLVGTQMITKGIHIPKVSFAAVVNADVGLALPDFRAEERTFQQIVQLIGRVGRGDEKGKVIVQSFQPERQVINFAVKNDYDSFYKAEIEMRRINELPPFSFLIRILVSSQDQGEAARAAEKIYHCLEKIGLADLKISGPVPAPFYKLHGRYRVQILLKTKAEPDRDLLDGIRRCAAFKFKNAKVQIEVDPLTLF